MLNWELIKVQGESVKGWLLSESGGRSWEVGRGVGSAGSDSFAPQIWPVTSSREGTMCIGVTMMVPTHLPWLGSQPLSRALEGGAKWPGFLRLHLARLCPCLSSSSSITASGTGQTQGYHQNSFSFKINFYLHFDSSGDSLFPHLESQLSETMTRRTHFLL